MPTNQIVAEHIRRNRQSRGCWQLYADHRRRVTQLLRQAAWGPNARLCVLGAGNCNDLDLKTLTDCYAEVHLVDLDAEALQFALSQQRPTGSGRVVLHGDVDVTGSLDSLAHGGPGDPVAQPERLKAPPRLPLPAPFDVVASVGLLTQLIDSVLLVVGPAESQYLPLVQAVRFQHLLLLTDLTRPGGQVLLTTEVVSSDTCPRLRSASQTELPSLLREQIERRNFFTGVNPAVLVELLRTEPELSERVESVEVLPPWTWRFLGRVYAVVAFRFQRK